MFAHVFACVHTGLCVCCLQKVGPAWLHAVSLFVLVGGGVCKENVAQGNAEQVERGLWG